MLDGEKSWSRHVQDSKTRRSLVAVPCSRCYVMVRYCTLPFETSSTHGWKGLAESAGLPTFM